MLAQEGHRMRLQRQPNGLVIVHDMLGQGHGGKHRRFVFQAFVARVRMREQRQVGRLPESARVP